MRWLIDGYNVIRRDADLRAHEEESLEAGRTALLRLVAQAARAGGDRFTVVFDGAPASRPAPAGGQVEVIFSRPPEKADDVLARLARPPGGGPPGGAPPPAGRGGAGRGRGPGRCARPIPGALGGRAGPPRTHRR